MNGCCVTPTVTTTPREFSPRYEISWTITDRESHLLPPHQHPTQRSSSTICSSGKRGNRQYPSSVDGPLIACVVVDSFNAPHIKTTPSQKMLHNIYSTSQLWRILRRMWITWSFWRSSSPSSWGILRPATPSNRRSVTAFARISINGHSPNALVFYNNW